MNLSALIDKTVSLAKSNSPEIMSALGIGGVVGTAILAGKASFNAARAIDREQYHIDRMPAPYELTAKEKFKLVWKLYVPTSLSGSVTIAAIVLASKGNGRRTAAAVAAYSLTERAFSEYKEKVVEQIGTNKEQKVRDEIAQDHVTKNPPSKEVVILGGGSVLCCELLTHRYFRSDMETLRKAQNDINAVALAQNYVALSDFYDILELPNTSESDNIGWDSERLMELRFSSVISEDGEPCLAFEYNYTKPLR